MNDLSEDEYRQTLLLIDRFWDAKDGTPAGKFLNFLVDSVIKYEDEHYPIPEPSLLSRIEYFFSCYRWWVPRNWVRYWFPKGRLM